MFSYDSKIMQGLSVAADFIICNVLFLVCCVPLFTIGAAQAGLYSALNTLLDREDGRPATRMFFEGFKTGFGRVTVAWLPVSLFLLLLGALCVSSLVSEINGIPAFLLMSVAAFALVCIYQSGIAAFHSRFQCAPKHLLKNVFIFTGMHPFRSVLVFILTWLPVGVAILLPAVFLKLWLLWILGYYSLAFAVNHMIMDKCYSAIAVHFA